jgi:hypothetical protein
MNPLIVCSQGRDEPSASNAKVHWSHLEPLSTNPVHGGDLPINGADLDEEAERRAFQEAVMDWRRGGSTNERGIKTLSISGRDTGGVGEGEGMWNNPFAPSASNHQTLSGDVLDEEAERRAFQEAVMEWRRGSSDLGKANHGRSRGGLGDSDDDDELIGSGEGWKKPSGAAARDRAEDEESSLISSARGERNLRSGGGPRLADGALDEEKEQAVR